MGDDMAVARLVRRWGRRLRGLAIRGHTLARRFMGAHAGGTRADNGADGLAEASGGLLSLPGHRLREPESSPAA